MNQNSDKINETRSLGDMDVIWRWPHWGANYTAPRTDAEALKRQHADKSTVQDELANRPPGWSRLSNANVRNERQAENGCVTQDHDENARPAQAQNSGNRRISDNQSWDEPDANGWIYPAEKSEDRVVRSTPDPCGDDGEANQTRRAGNEGVNADRVVQREFQAPAKGSDRGAGIVEPDTNAWGDRGAELEQNPNQNENTWVHQELPVPIYRAPPEDPLGYRPSYDDDGQARAPYPHEMARSQQRGRGRIISSSMQQTLVTAGNLEMNNRSAIAAESQRDQHQSVARRCTLLRLERQASSAGQEQITEACNSRPPVPTTPQASQIQNDPRRRNKQNPQPSVPIGLQEVPAQPAPLSAAQRRQLGRPRPDSQFSVSTRSETSTVVISDAGLGEVSSGAGPDIRNETAPAHDINASDGTWRIHNWEGQDVREVTRSESFLGKFVESWQSAIPGDVIVDFIVLVDQHWHMDVNTETGEPLTPVDYPVTSPHPDPISQELQFRRSNSSSTLQIEKELESRGRRRGGPRPSFRPGITTPGLPEVVRPRTPSPPPGFPRIPCYLRPADEKDMEQVSQIYNLEITGDEGHAMDTNELSSQEMFLLLKACRKENHPFIVVVQGSLAQKPNAQGNPGYRHQLASLGANSNGKILGFGVVSNFMTGVTRSYSVVASKVGRMLAVVHPSFRRKGIGSACMTKLITCLDPTFHPDEKYDFVNPRGDAIYRGAQDHQDLPFCQLAVEVLIRNKVMSGNRAHAHLTNRRWLLDRLRDKFGFSEHMFLEQVGDSRATSMGVVYSMNMRVFTRGVGAKC
jgi:ribosomal protein S18 acetylase RimI-like enzyme